ncbi:MAG: hypothetical protein PUD16_04900 [bacterium]|nr:hypothetical protein [bacterium]
MEKEHAKPAETFSYTYSAKQQAEIQEIRKKYLPKEEDKLTQLRKLDEQPVRKACSVSLTVGIISSLILGFGMSCCMVWGGKWFVPGIMVGLIGLAGCAAAYPLYQYVVKKERRKIAPRVIALTDELMK